MSNEAKCPACGWRIDPSAYRCPKCGIYFCFKCRVRVTASETQFQCADQKCANYGKLLCSACTVMVKQETAAAYDRTLTVTKTEEGHVGKLLLGAGAVGLVSLFFAPVAAAAGVVTATAVGGGLLMRKLGVNLFDETRETQVPEHVPAKHTEHRCCIVCKHAVKNL